MPNKLYITKVLPDGYGVGVIPEMEKPKVKDYASDMKRDYESHFRNYEKHLASLPTFLIHPSFNPKEGGWIEQWREGWEILYHDDSWRLVDKTGYDSITIEPYRRIVLLPLVEKKELFNEDKLRKEIANKWGDYGAHIEVFDMIISQNKRYRNTLQKVLDKDGYEFVKDAISGTPPEGNTPASEQGDENYQAVAADALEWLVLLQSTLTELVELKRIKDSEDKTPDYEKRQPLAWERAFEVMYLLEKDDGYFKKFQSPPSLQEREKGWVDVNDRLPEISNDEQHKRVIINVWDWTRKPMTMFAIYYKGNFYGAEMWWSDGEDSPTMTNSVTHWQPLPSPPNESEDTAKQSK